MAKEIPINYNVLIIRVKWMDNMVIFKFSVSDWVETGWMYVTVCQSPLQHMPILVSIVGRTIHKQTWV